jgi:hypothetical protein
MVPAPSHETGRVDPRTGDRGFLSCVIAQIVPEGTLSRKAEPSSAAIERQKMRCVGPALVMTSDVAGITRQHPLHLLNRHRPPGPLPPLRLGAGDQLGAKALVEATMTVRRVFVGRGR